MAMSRVRSTESKSRSLREATALAPTLSPSSSVSAVDRCSISSAIAITVDGGGGALARLRWLTLRLSKVAAWRVWGDGS